MTILIYNNFSIFLDLFIQQEESTLTLQGVFWLESSRGPKTIIIFYKN